MLRDHGDDFRMSEQDLAHLVDGRHRCFERDRLRHRRPDPEIALLERGQKLGAEPRYQHAHDGKECRPDRHHELAVGQRPAQRRRINPAKRTNHDRLGLVHLLGKQVRSQHRRDREGRDQRAKQCIAVSPRHGIEDLAFDPLHGEQRNEGGHGDGSGEEDGLVDLERADEDRAQPVGPSAHVRGVRVAGRVRPVLSCGQLLEKLLSLVRSRLKIAEYVLDQDHRRIDDDSEIDGPDRQQIGILAAQHQDDDAEEQREGNVDADDDGAAQVAEEDPLDEEHQKTAEDEVVQDRVRRDRHERRAVVERNELHPRRQGPVAVDLLDLRLDARHDIIGVQGPVHNHDRGDDVVLTVATGFAQPRHVADIDIGDVLDLHRNAVGLCQDDVLDVVDPVALRQVLGPAAVQETDASDVHGLLADIDRASAHIGIGVADRGQNLRKGDVVGVEFVEVDLDLVFFGGAAPGVDLNDAFDRQQAALHHPVLDGAKIGQPDMGRPNDLITIDLAHQARALNLRRYAVGQADILLQAERRLREGKIVVDAVFEDDADERQPIERRRADDVDAGRGRKPDLHRDGVVALHLLGGLACGLGGDFQDHRRRVRIGLDVQLGERHEAGADEHQQAQEDNRAPGQSEC